MKRALFTQRRGQRTTTVSFEQVKRLVLDLYDEWIREGYFQEWFGYDCVDAGFVPGGAGSDPAAYVFRTTLSDEIWPLREKCATWSEGELFDAIEFLYDHASAGSGGRYHDWGNCGQHFDTFDSAAGRARLREDLNPLLAGYGVGYELTKDGEVSEVLSPHMSILVETPLPAEVPVVVAEAVRRAIELHRHRGSDDKMRRDAARQLADAFEYMRPQVKSVLHNKDDGLIFQLANEFHIRHSNPSQIAGYDPRWLKWIFEFYLSTLFVCFDLLGWKAAPASDDRRSSAPVPEPAPSFDPDEIPF